MLVTCFAGFASTFVVQKAWKMPEFLSFSFTFSFYNIKPLLPNFLAKNLKPECRKLDYLVVWLKVGNQLITSG